MNEKPWRLRSTNARPYTFLVRLDGEELIIAGDLPAESTSLDSATTVFHFRKVDPKRADIASRLRTLTSEVIALRKKGLSDQAHDAEKLRVELVDQLRDFDKVPQANILLAMAAYTHGIGQHDEADQLEKQAAEIRGEARRQRQEEEDRRLPRIDDMPPPSAEEIANGPFDWVVLKNGDVIVVEAIYPRPNTLGKIADERKAIESQQRGTPTQQQQRRQRLKELQSLKIVLIDRPSEEFLLPLKEVERIVAFEELEKMAGVPGLVRAADSLDESLRLKRETDDKSNPLVGDWILDCVESGESFGTVLQEHIEFDGNQLITVTPTRFLVEIDRPYTLDRSSTPWRVFYTNGPNMLVQLSGSHLKVAFHKDNKTQLKSFREAGADSVVMILRRVDTKRNRVLEQIVELRATVAELRLDGAFAETDAVEERIAKLVADLKALDRIPYANSLSMMSVHARMLGDHDKADQFKFDAARIVAEVRKESTGSDNKTVNALVAATALPPHAKLSGDNTRHVTVKSDALPEGAILNPEDAWGRRLKMPRAAGDWIVSSILTADEGFTEIIPPGMRVMTLPTSFSDATQDLAPGNRVDVLLTYKEKAPDSRLQTLKARRLLSDIEVFAVGKRPQAAGSESPTHISLLVTADESLKLKLAKDRGELSFVLRATNDDRPDGKSELSENDLLMSNAERRSRLKTQLASAETEFAEAQKQSLATAEKYRGAKDDVERHLVNQTLVEYVSTAFDAQQQVHSCKTKLAEIELLELNEKQSRRKALRQQVIERRVEDLLNGGDLQ